MTYISIDTNKKQAALFVEYLKTLSFVTIHQEHNLLTGKAIEDAKKHKTKRHESAKSLINYLNK